MTAWRLTLGVSRRQRISTETVGVLNSAITPVDNEFGQLVFRHHPSSLVGLG
jgi:hypothetical protein